jgi:hypothetical protein
MTSRVKRDHHTWTRDTIKNVSGDITLDVVGDISLDAGGNDINFLVNGTSYMNWNVINGFTLKEASDTDDYFRITVAGNGITTFSSNDDSGSNLANLTFQPEGGIYFDPPSSKKIYAQQDLSLTATKKLILDGGGGDTYIVESADDKLDFYSGDGLILRLYNASVLGMNTEISGGTITSADATNTYNHALKITTILNDDSDSGSSTYNLIEGILTNTDITGWDELYLLHLTGAGLFWVDNAANVYMAGSTFTSAGHLAFDVAGNILFDSNTGIFSFLDAGDSDDIFKITVTGGTGATTLQTVSAGDDGHLAIKSDGDLILDSGSGKIEAHKAGTEYSVSGSAYAGMILGYRLIGESGGHATYTTTTSFAVPDSAMTIRFIAPPSGVVEVEVQIYVDSSSGRSITFALSDNATFNTLGASYEQLIHIADETDQQVVQNKWVVSGLTAGSTYNYWFGAKGSGGSNTLAWGGTGSGRWPDFIMKATALPVATTDFAVYG